MYIAGGDIRQKAPHKKTALQWQYMQLAPSSFADLENLYNQKKRQDLAILAC